MNKAKIAAASALVLMTATACSSSGGSGESSSATAPTSAAASTAAGGAVTSYHDAQGAVIQIAAEGEFLDPGMAAGEQGAWSGSGFIIDPSGIAVTNAHVAEGAATLKVYVGGSKEAINAKVLGISECNDLAAIDLAGDGFPYLAWHQGPLDVTTEVWAAGFPLGDPQYTGVDGTISKNNALGGTEWASLDYRLEHTAPIQHGNSGGPLLLADGTVGGVNYAGGYGNSNTDQFYAIPAALAEPVVDVLKGGADQDSIGINGQAFYDEESSLAGIWVSGVRSGSPASNAGVKSGDVIIQMEGRDAVSDSDVEAVAGTAVVTKAGYCDVLRTKGSDKPIRIQVYRPGTGEVLEGEVNNPLKPLAPITAVNNDSAGQSGTDTSATDSTSVAFTSVTDDTGAMTVDVPDAWSVVSTAPGDGFGSISASTDAQGFADGTAPGVEYYAFDGTLSNKELKATMKALEGDESIAAIISTCEDSEAGTVQEGDGYTFVGNSYWSCQGSDLSYYLSIRNYADKGKFVVLDGQFSTDQEVEFVNRSLASLVVN